LQIIVEHDREKYDCKAFDESLVHGYSDPPSQKIFEQLPEHFP